MPPYSSRAVPKISIDYFLCSSFILFLCGMFQNGTHHFFLQFAGFKNVFEVLGCGGALHAKQVGNFLLREPDGFVLQIDFHFFLSVWNGVN